MTRQDELREAATDYVLEHGLIGLSLRPLAAAVGTSDRMLVYHFGSKDGLLVAVLESVTDRSNAVVRSLPPARTVRAGVVRLWRAHLGGQLDRCQKVYVQAAASGLLGDEPFRSAVRRANAGWADALAAYLVACGAPGTRVARVVDLVDAGLTGLHLDLPVADDADDLERAVADLAEAAQRLAVGPGGAGRAGRDRAGAPGG
jgi:AcrR family transcriptional regulator